MLLVFLTPPYPIHRQGRGLVFYRGQRRSSRGFRHLIRWMEPPPSGGSFQCRSRRRTVCPVSDKSWTVAEALRHAGKSQTLLSGVLAQVQGQEEASQSAPALSRGQNLDICPRNPQTSSHRHKTDPGLVWPFVLRTQPQSIHPFNPYLSWATVLDAVDTGV